MQAGWIRTAARAGSSSREAGGSVEIVCTLLTDPFRLCSHIHFKSIHVCAAADSTSPRPSHLPPARGLGGHLLIYGGAAPNENLTFCSSSGWLSAGKWFSFFPPLCHKRRAGGESAALGLGFSLAQSWCRAFRCEWIRRMLLFWVCVFFNVSIKHGFPTCDTRREVKFCKDFISKKFFSWI